MVDDVKKLHYKQCKYKVEEAAIVFPDGKEHKINGRLDIPYIMMKKDFDNEQYPFFVLSVTISNKLYRKMKEVNDQLKFRINIRYAFFDKGDVAIDTKVTDERPFINDTFYLFLDDTSPLNQDEVYKELEEHTPYGAQEEDITDLNSATTIRIALYNQMAITVPKKLHKVVLHDVSVTDVMTYILQNFGFTKILMSPSSNGKKYDQFILPPEQLDYQLDRIANEYGLHDNGSLLFFDYDRLYITEKTPKCTAWEPNEVKRVYVVTIPVTENNALLTGAYEDKEANEIYLTTKTQSIETVTMANEIASGSGILVINKRTGKAESFVIDGDSIKAAPKFTGKNGESSIKYDKTIVINTGEDTITALKKRLNEKAYVWNVFLDSTMVDALKPNREYCMVFTDPDQAKYNGTYRLVNLSAEFDVSMSDSQWRGVNTLATFVGIPNNTIGEAKKLLNTALNAMSSYAQVSNLYSTVMGMLQ